MFSKLFSLGPPEGGHLGGRRVGNILNQVCQSTQSMGLLIAVAVPVIDPFDALDGVTKYPLGDVWSDTGTTHQRSSSAAKVVNGPRRNLNLCI